MSSAASTSTTISPPSNTLSVRNLSADLVGNFAAEIEQLSEAIHPPPPQYVLFKTLNAASLIFPSHDHAAHAKALLLDKYPFLQVEFSKPISLQGDSSSLLQVPANNKAFLLSPPASPPLDWEPTPEKAPVVHDEAFVNDLYGRLQNVQLQQVFQGGNDDDVDMMLPSIVVEDCDFGKPPPASHLLKPFGLGFGFNPAPKTTSMTSPSLGVSVDDLLEGPRSHTQFKRTQRPPIVLPMLASSS